jgi:hypothetical protein
MTTTAPSLFAPGQWACEWEVTGLLGAPRKVVLAKARKLIKRGLLGGCGCGCRGDWHVLAPGQKSYEPPYNPPAPVLGEGA